MLKIKNIPKLRVQDCSRKKTDNLDPHFIGHLHSYKDENGKDREMFGFFDHINGKTKTIHNKLTTNLNMAQDTQAIFEFVQNAVDAGSSDFFMYYDDERFIALNNGDYFTHENILSILSVGASDKSMSPEDEEMIGRFGVGFKLIHRMVGTQSGVDELINENAGPIMFSWKNREHLDELLQVDGYEDLELGDPELNGEDPWFFKFLLTCFPMIPQKLDADVRNLDYKTISGNERALFDEQELNDFIQFLNLFWIARFDELKEADLSTGSIFYLKLGDGKKDKLDEDFEHYRSGLNYSLRFIETLREKDGLKNIYFNRFEPITSENVKLNVDTPIVIPSDSDDYLKIEELLEEKDRGIDIKYRFAFEPYPLDPDSEIGLVKHEPNFFKYFPIGKENHKLNFILHCNAFKIETSRREFQQDDKLNSKLLSTFTKHFIERLNQYKESDRDLYIDLFLSILLSDNPGVDRDTYWIRDTLYNPLKEQCRKYVPIMGRGYAPAEKVVTKDSTLTIDSSLLDTDVHWFDFQYRGEVNIKIVECTFENLGIEIWKIGKIIQEMPNEQFESWYYSISDSDKKELLSEISDCLDGNLGNRFWKNIQVIDGIHSLISECDSSSAKKKYLLSFDRIELKASEINAENNHLLNIFKLVELFKDDKEFLNSFRKQFVIVTEEGEEFPLIDVAQKDDISFEFDDTKVTLRLSEILPDSFKKTSGVFSPVYSAFKELEIEVDTLFGIGSTRAKNLIRNEITKPESTYTPEQLVFLLYYSLQEGSKQFDEFPKSIVIPTIGYLWKNELFLPESFQQDVVDKKLNLCVYPNELALEKERIAEPIVQWVQKDEKNKASKLEFLKSQGLKTEYHPHIKLRKALLNNTAESKHLDLTKEFTNSKDLAQLFEFSTAHEITLTGPSKGIFKKLTTTAKAISVSRVQIPIPVIDEMAYDNTTLKLLDRRTSQTGYKLSKDYFEDSSNQPCSVEEMLTVLNENEKFLIDSRYIESSYIEDIDEVELIPGNDIQAAQDMRLKLSYRFIEEWQSKSDYKLYFFKNRVPRCIRFNDFIFRQYEGGFFHFDKDTNSVFVGQITNTDENTVFISTLQLFEKNRNVHPTLENLYKEFKKVDPEELRKKKTDAKYYKNLTQKSEPFTGEWLEYSIQWEKARKEESFYKSRKLRFNSIEVTPDGKLTLSKYQYDTLPGFLEAYELFENIKVYSEETSESISISAALLKVDDFELTLQLDKGANPNELISICQDKNSRATIMLPKDDPWLKQLHSVLFTEELIKPDDYLRELVTNRWHSDSIGFIFGPPGTGKTTRSALYALLEIARAKSTARSLGVLVLTPTNKAADVFIEKCFDFINNPEIVHQIDVGFSDSEKQLLFDFLSDDDTTRLIYRYGRTISTKIPSLQVGQNIPVEDQTIVATTIHRYVFNQAVNMYPLRFSSGACKVIIDEASMVPLPYAMHVLLTMNSENEEDEFHGKLTKLTIAGDPFQIQPVGLSPHPGETRSYNGWTTESLYSLLQLNKFNRDSTPVGNYGVENLKRQYRSNAEIGELYSAYQYDNLLEHHHEVLTGDLDQRFPKSIYYLKFGVHDFEDEQNTLTKLYHYKTYPTYHLYSCVLAVELAAQIRSASSESILVLSPYGIQARILRDLIENDQNRFSQGNISASTIHGAQGDQADHVILVQNPSKIYNSGLTFFNNANLINVGISRAKKKLFILAPDTAMIKGVKELNDRVLTFDHQIVTYGKYEFEADHLGGKDYLNSIMGVKHFSDFLIEDISNGNFGSKKYQFYSGDGKIFCWFNSD